MKNQICHARWALPMLLQAVALGAAPVVASDEDQVITITRVQADAAPEAKAVGDSPKGRVDAKATIVVRTSADGEQKGTGVGAGGKPDDVPQEGRTTVRGQIRVMTPDGKSFEVVTPDGIRLLKDASDRSAPGTGFITIQRSSDGELQKLEAGNVQKLLGELTARVKDGAESPKFVIGVSVSEAPAVVMTQLGRPDTPAVVVDAVVTESAAEKAGVQKFDLILKAAGEPVKTPTELTQAVKASEGKPIELVLVRTGQELTLELTPRSNEVPAATLKDARAMVHFGPGMMMPPQAAFYGQFGQPQGNLLEEVKAMRKDLDELKKLIEDLKAAK